MTTYFITFIVPVYKVEYNQLRKCIDSILNQKNCTTSYEILLVDDGSPDECPSICDEYAERNEHVRVIHQQNQGLSVVRNVGVCSAQGEWISFVDGDDWIEPCFVAFAEESLKQMPHDCDIMIWDGFSETKRNSTPINFLNTTNKSLQVFKGINKEILINKILPRYVKRVDIDKCTDIGITWGRIYKKKFLTDNNIENVPGLRLMQDSVFNLWAFEYARCICYQFKPLYHYSMYDGSISKKYDGTAAATMKVLYGHYADYIKRCHDNEDYWQRLYIRTVRLLVKCLSKDYANPLNALPMHERIAKMKREIEISEFQTALCNCNPKGQEFKFRFILFLLRNKLYGAAIMTSRAFMTLRRLKK